MTVLDTTRVDSRWHVPAGALSSRVLVACTDPDVEPESTVAALADARSSVLLVDLPHDRPARHVASIVEGLLRDGCLASELSVVGVGRSATVAPAACLLLRINGVDLPGALALVRDDCGLVQAPAGEPTEALVELMAAWAARPETSTDHRPGLRVAARGVDRVLSAGWS